MGSCVSNDYYGIFRKSIPGSTLPDHDFDAFCKVCKYENHTISNHLHLHTHQAFYVVISGEIVANLATLNSKPNIAAVFQSGDMIHFFSNESITSDGIIVTDAAKIQFTFKSKDKNASVIGIDRVTLEAFLVSRPHLVGLKSLCDISLKHFVLNRDCQSLRSLTPNQMNVLGPLMKLRNVNEGDFLNISIAAASSKSTPVRHYETLMKGMGLVSPIGFLLQGTCMCLDPTFDLAKVEAVLSKLNISSPSIGSRRSGHHPSSHTYSSFTTPNNQRVRRKSVLEGIRETFGIHYQKAQIHFEEVSTANLTSDGSESDKMILKAGNLYGLEYYFMSDPRVALHHIISCETGLVGAIDGNTLDRIKEVDPRCIRVMERNFNRNVLNSVKDAIPMLCDMDDRSYSLLSSKVKIKSLPSGETIYSKGHESDFTYIVVLGSVLEISELPNAESDLDTSSEVPKTPVAVNHYNLKSPSPNSTTFLSYIPASFKKSKKNHEESKLVNRSENNKTPPVTVERSLGKGTLFGEVSLITDSPYLNSTYTTDLSVLISISKRNFDQIYHDNKSKLAEIRIKLAGNDVALEHVINHPEGYSLLYQFLEREMAVENLKFWHAVDRFDDMCERLKRHYAALERSNSVAFWLSENSDMILRNEVGLNDVIKEVERSLIDTKLPFVANVTSPKEANRLSFEKRLQEESLTAHEDRDARIDNTTAQVVNTKVGLISKAFNKNKPNKKQTERMDPSFPLRDCLSNTGTNSSPLGNDRTKEYEDEMDEDEEGDEQNSVNTSITGNARPLSARTNKSVISTIPMIEEVRTGGLGLLSHGTHSSHNNSITSVGMVHTFDTGSRAASSRNVSRSQEYHLPPLVGNSPLPVTDLIQFSMLQNRTKDRLSIHSIHTASLSKSNDSERVKTNEKVLPTLEQKEDGSVIDTGTYLMDTTSIGSLSSNSSDNLNKYKQQKQLQMSMEEENYTPMTSNMNTGVAYEEPSPMEKGERTEELYGELNDEEEASNGLKRSSMQYTGLRHSIEESSGQSQRDAIQLQDETVTQRPFIPFPAPITTQYGPKPVTTMHGSSVFPLNHHMESLKRLSMSDQSIIKVYQDDEKNLQMLHDIQRSIDSLEGSERHVYEPHHHHIHHQHHQAMGQNFDQNTVDGVMSVSSGMEWGHNIPRNSHTRHIFKAKFQKIDKTILELQEVGRRIVDSYILANAPYEVNIPGKMRKETERMFYKWILGHFEPNNMKATLGNPVEITYKTESNSHETEEGSHVNRFKAINFRKSITSSFLKASFSAFHFPDEEFRSGSMKSSNWYIEIDDDNKFGPIKNLFFNSLDYDIAMIFREPKQEVFNLLKRDIFIRWKQTPEFQYFINTIKPYHHEHSHLQNSSVENNTNRTTGTTSTRLRDIPSLRILKNFHKSSRLYSPPLVTTTKPVPSSGVRNYLPGFRMSQQSSSSAGLGRSNHSLSVTQIGRLQFQPSTMSLTGGRFLSSRMQTVKSLLGFRNYESNSRSVNNLNSHNNNDDYEFSDEED